MKKLLCLLLVFCMVGCGSSNEGTASSTDEEGPGQEIVDEDVTPTFGTVIEFSNLEIIISESIEFIVLNNEFVDLNGSDIIKIPVTIKNVGSEDGGFNVYYVAKHGSQGATLEGVGDNYVDDDVRWSGKVDSLSSGESVSVFMYILYDGDGDYYVSFNNRSEKIEIRLPITK